MNELDISATTSSKATVKSDDKSSGTPVKNVDNQTIERIRSLALVGDALFETTNEIGFQTKFYEAKESLNKFKDEIEKLELDADSRRGIMNLVHYLHGKIDKRLAHSQVQNEEPMR